MNLTERRILSGCAAEEVGDIRESVRIYEDILSFCEHSAALAKCRCSAHEDRSVAAVTFYRLWPEDCPENGNLAVVGRTA